MLKNGVLGRSGGVRYELYHGSNIVIDSINHVVELA